MSESQTIPGRGWRGREDLPDNRFPERSRNWNRSSYLFTSDAGLVVVGGIGSDIYGSSSIINRDTCKSLHSTIAAALHGLQGTHNKVMEEKPQSGGGDYIETVVNDTINNPCCWCWEKFFATQAGRTTRVINLFVVCGELFEGTYHQMVEIFYPLVVKKDECRFFLGDAN